MKFLTVWAPLALTASLFAADIALVEEIVAKVNGDIITRSEIERARRQLETELKARGMKSPELEKIVADREKDALRERIDQLLLVQKGKEIGISVEQDVSKYLADIQLQAKIPDPEKFQQYIREQSGQSFEDFKSEIRNGYLTQRVIRQEVGGRLTVPRAELEKYYNENKSKYMREDRVFLREILVSTEGKDAAGIAAAEKKARDLSARAKKGEKFPEMARANSDSTTKDQYGELGGFKLTELDKSIRDVLASADRNFVTDPIRIANGFLILKVEERHKAGQASFEEVEQEIMNELIQPKFQPQVREYLTKLRYESFLEIKPGYVDSGAAEGKNTAWTDPAQLRPETVTKEEVQAQTRNRRLLWMLPIPGTSTPVKKPGTSSSQ
ncbi:MAG TPA: peptidyl-prolyl cis-trans isomerase [Bryobacteraceae bacterium]|nr:peptidyl-prolyl cis-trans isomerase [Bryobacteraceae bacterium]